jgi:hypothetical protein
LALRTTSPVLAPEFLALRFWFGFSFLLFFVFFYSVVSSCRFIFNVEVPDVVMVPNLFGLTHFLPLLVFYWMFLEWFWGPVVVVWRRIVLIYRCHVDFSQRSTVV